MSKSYKESGVSLEAGYESVNLMKKHVEKTKRLGMFSNIGSFGGMFDLSALKKEEPILVSGTDGVGTKLMIAFLLDKHDTIGIDLVAMCVNDVLAQGAEPLFFLDYIATSKVIPSKIESIVKGVCDGCVQANCMLVGGETAEMPDLYQDHHYDLAGFCVGVVEKKKLITGQKVNVGDLLIGLQSSGIHSNGYSLVRKICFKDHQFDMNKTYGMSKPLGELLIEPTRIYVKSVLNLLKEVDIHSVMHITGGGFYENLPRGILENQGIEIEESSFEILEIFKFLEEHGNIDHLEMFNVFNMGIGMCLVIKPEDREDTLRILQENGEKAFVIGRVTDQPGVKIL